MGDDFVDNICDYKLAVITSDSIAYRGNILDGSRHQEVMREYGVEVYGDDSIFGIIDDETRFSVAEYFLAEYQNILFYNLSGDDYEFGILYVLDNISDVQLRIVNDFLDSLEGFTVEFDSYVTIDDKLYMNEPFEETFDDGFLEIRKFLKDISINSNYLIKK